MLLRRFGSWQIFGRRQILNIHLAHQSLDEVLSRYLEECDAWLRAMKQWKRRLPLITIAMREESEYIRELEVAINPQWHDVHPDEQPVFRDILACNIDEEVVNVSASHV